MTVKIMYMGYQSYFLNLAKEMEKDEWDPVYWSVVADIQEKVKIEYPNAICHNHYDAIKGIPPKEYANKALAPLCPLLFEKMAGYERNALRMLERNDSHTNTFTYRERVDLYRYLVQYWSTVVKDLEPQHVVFEEEPHQACDYVLYAICCVMDVNTIMFIRTKFHERMYPVRKFEEGSEIIRKAYQNELTNKSTDSVLLSSSMEEYFSSLQGCYDNAVSLHLYDQVDEVQDIYAKKSHFTLSIKKFIKTTISKFNRSDLLTRWRLLTSKSGIFFVSDQKQKNKLFKDSNLTYVEHLFYKTKAIYKKQKLKRYYNTISEKSYDLSQPYVFCALQYQPEKSTCPLGGDYDDQIFMLKTLSAALPDSWLIYVKDHPSQFVSSYTRYGEHFRSTEFYREISKIQNVRLLSLNSDTFELIDNSKAVATVSGTSAWEGVVRGIPALVFGYAWFKHCNGVFYVYSYESVKASLKKIFDGYKVNANEVKVFAKTVEEHSFKGVVGGPGLRKYFNINDSENSIAHSYAIKALLKNK